MKITKQDIECVKQRIIRDRERQRKHHEKIKAEGKKACSNRITQRRARVFITGKKADQGDHAVIIYRSLMALKKEVTRHTQPVFKTEIEKTTLPDRKKVLTMISDMKKQGLSHKQIAENLNDKGIATFSGRGKWQPGTVEKLIKKG